LFFLFSIGDCGSPEYFCQFVYHEKPLHRIRYDVFNSESWNEPRVSRNWKWTDWATSQLRKQQRSRPADDLFLSLFDLNNNGKLDREEGVAANAAGFSEMKIWEIEQGYSPSTELLDFSLVERTFTIELPKGQ
jgi:hypothetical protein